MIGENGWLGKGSWEKQHFCWNQKKKKKETKTFYLGKVQESKSKQGVLPSEEMVNAKTLMC